MCPSTALTARREWPLRRYLLTMQLGLVLPIAVFAAWIVARYDANEQARHARLALEFARELSRAADDLAADRMSTLRLLATDPDLRSGKLRAFHRRLNAMTGDEPFEVAFFSPAGEAVLVTRTPFASPLKLPHLGTLVADAASQDAPQVSGWMADGSSSAQVAFAMPVRDTDRIVGVLVTTARVDAVSSIFSTVATPPDWTLVLSDAGGVIIARSAKADLYVGHALPPETLERSGATEGLIEAKDVEGRPTVQGYRVSKLTRWRAAASIPRAVLTEHTTQSWRLFALLALALLAATTMWAALLNRHLATAFDDTVRLAQDMPATGHRNLRGGRLLEINRIRDAIERATARESAWAAARAADARELTTAVDRFRAAEEAARALVYDWDLRTGTVWRSDGLTRVLGYDRGEVPPTVDWWRSVIHPEDLSRLAGAIERMPRSLEHTHTEYRVRHKAGHYVWFWDRARLFRGDDGAIDRIVGSSVDVTALKAMELERSRLARIVEESPDLIASTTTGLEIVYMNRAGRAALGLPLDGELPTRNIADFQAGFESHVREADVSGIWIGDSHILTKGDRSTPVSQVIVAHRDGTGRPSHYSTICRDMTERVGHEQHQRLLVAELSHRTKNLLAIVHSVASRTLRNDAANADVRGRLLGRLAALGQAHDLLIDSDWRGVEFRRVVAIATDAISQRTSFDGPSLSITPQAVQNFALILFELTTNALSHGSLSVPGGVVRISWFVYEHPAGQRFAFTWTEEGGPPVRDPQDGGFGQLVLASAIAQDQEHPPRIEYLRQGLRYRLDAPLETITKAPGNPASF